MTVSFPPIRPSNRTFTKGTYPVKRQKFPAGTGFSKRFGTNPIDPILSLEFANIPDADANLIAKAYDDASGPYEPILLPIELWLDLTQGLRSHLRDKPFYWRFSQPPTFSRSSIPGYKTVTVELIGDYRLPDLPDGLNYPPRPPEPGPDSPTQVDSTGLRQVRLDWVAEEYGTSIFYSSGSDVLSYYGELWVEYSSVTTIDRPYGSWRWVSGDSRDPVPIINHNPYSGQYLFRSGPKVFSYAPV